MTNITHAQAKQTLVRILLGLLYDKLQNELFIKAEIRVMTHQSMPCHPGVVGIATTGAEPTVTWVTLAEESPEYIVRVSWTPDGSQPRTEKPQPFASFVMGSDRRARLSFRARDRLGHPRR